jgi:hypothetical protein
MVSMTARYNGTCALCSQRFAPGTRILWAKHTRETVHAEPAACKRPVAAPQAPQTDAEWDAFDAYAYAHLERMAERHAYMVEMEIDAAREEEYERKAEQQAYINAREDEEWAERMADLAYSHADDLNNA